MASMTKSVAAATTSTDDDDDDKKKKKIMKGIVEGEYLGGGFIIKEIITKYLTNDDDGGGLLLEQEENNLERIKIFRQQQGTRDILDKYKVMLYLELKKVLLGVEKSAEMSNLLREEGNVNYRIKKDFKKAMRCFTLAFCFANDEDTRRESFLALANRSACLYELGKYTECGKDVDSALKLVLLLDEKLERVRVKLLERKEKCGRKKEEEESNYSSEEDKKKKKNIFELESKSRLIESAADFVVIEEDEEVFGRHVRVTRDVPPGTTIIVEDPWVKVLVNEYRWEVRFCHHCFRDIEFTSSLSCPNCVFATYCSLECRKESKPLHDFTCKISGELHVLRLERLVRLSLQTALKLQLQLSSGSSSSCNKTENKGTEVVVARKDGGSGGGGGILGFDEKDGGRYSSSSYFPLSCLVSDVVSEVELRRYCLDSILLTELTLSGGGGVGELNEMASVLLLHQLNYPVNAHSCNMLKVGDFNDSESIRLGETVDFGAGAYALLSMINHSCDPNVTRITLPPPPPHNNTTTACGGGGKTAVVTLRTLRKGEQVLDNYGSHYALEESSVRKAYLKSHYNFDCACDPCTFQWPTIYQNKKNTVSFTTNSEEEEEEEKFNLAYDLVLKNQPVQAIHILKRVLTNVNNNYVNFAQETLKHALNLLAIQNKAQFN